MTDETWTRLHAGNISAHLDDLREAFGEASSWLPIGDPQMLTVMAVLRCTDPSYLCALLYQDGERRGVISGEFVQGTNGKPALRVHALDFSAWVYNETDGSPNRDVLGEFAKTLGVSAVEIIAADPPKGFGQMGTPFVEAGTLYRKEID